MTTNLDVVRGPRSRTLTRGDSSRHRRLAVILTAGVLVVYARRGPLWSRLLGSVAVTLAGRALAGHDDLGAVLARRQFRRLTPDDQVDAASSESFPASDAPPWTPTATHGGSA